MSRQDHWMYAHYLLLYKLETSLSSSGFERGTSRCLRVDPVEDSKPRGTTFGLCET